MKSQASRFLFTKPVSDARLPPDDYPPLGVGRYVGTWGNLGKGNQQRGYHSLTLILCLWVVYPYPPKAQELKGWMQRLRELEPFNCSHQQRNLALFLFHSCPLSPYSQLPPPTPRSGLPNGISSAPQLNTLHTTLQAAYRRRHHLCYRRKVEKVEA